MFYNQITKQVNKFMNKRFISQLEFINKINNFTKYNIQYIDYFELKIKNPTKLNFLTPTVYEGTVHFDKGDMRIYKTFHNNDINNLFIEVSNFINKEIKL